MLGNFLACKPLDALSAAKVSEGCAHISGKSLNPRGEKWLEPNLELPRRSPFQNEGLKSHLTRSNPSRANVYALIDAIRILSRTCVNCLNCALTLFSRLYTYIFTIYKQRLFFRFNCQIKISDKRINLLFYSDTRLFV